MRYTTHNLTQQEHNMARPDVTKADLLRAQIQRAVNGEFPSEDLIPWAMTHLGFKRALARTYVKNLYNELFGI